MNGADWFDGGENYSVRSPLCVSNHRRATSCNWVKGSFGVAFHAGFALTQHYIAGRHGAEPLYIVTNLLHLMDQWCSNCDRDHCGTQILLQKFSNRIAAEVFGAVFKHTKRPTASVVLLPLRTPRDYKIKCTRLPVRGSGAKDSIVRSTSRRLDGPCQVGRVGYVVSIN